MAASKLRERRVLKLASEIVGLMRKHRDRLEAIDAYDAAKILFRDADPPISAPDFDVRRLTC